MFIKRLALKKILSFNDAEIELGQLNVLIGPNAVGKSNLIEVLGLLQAAPNSSLVTAILRGGGLRQWLWMGDPVASPPNWPVATIECELNLIPSPQVGALLYKLSFSDQSGGLIILDENLIDTNPGSGSVTYFRRSSTHAEFGPVFLGTKTQPMTLPPGESFLSQFKNPADTTPMTEVGKSLAQIRIFREFKTGPGSPARYGISTSAPKDVLADGSDNLALVLHELDFLGVHDRIRDYLRRFCERFEDVKVNVGEGLARTYLREAGLTEMLSAIRMSDGTLKFLSLLAALFNPKPPPLMCIEEPEVGLHPDALQLVAEALIEASESMQLIVTTHSEALVDALSDRPESVIVCERGFDNGTQMKHLSKERLKVWLEHYTLGQLWRDGEIGGGRW
jgi:predicted ATPase